MLFLSVGFTKALEPLYEDKVEFESLNRILIKKEFIFVHAPFPSCHASTIEQVPSGELVASWFGGTAENHPDCSIWVSRTENGRWTFPIKVREQIDNQGNHRPCWNPVLFQPKEGPLILFYKVTETNDANDVTHYHWRGERLLSFDEGKTWTGRIRFKKEFIGPSKNKPIQLKDGTILCPSNFKIGDSDSAVTATKDYGVTWTTSSPLNVAKIEGGSTQGSFLRYSENRIQMICRNNTSSTGNLRQFWSEDNGKTWSKMSDLNLPNPNSGTDAVTLIDERQLLVYNHSHYDKKNNIQGRSVLNLAVSKDGIQWNAVCILENQKGEYSYPAIIQTEDGSVHLVYTWQRKLIKHVIIDPKKIEGTPIVDGIWPETVH
ncbi:MAG: exo-alpha-sialidase [Planctomycetaceae bacterium]|jgi:predicted neuraminidase|nr:exo-alpha-sialidase [Planctomycetaceae bacterium]